MRNASLFDRSLALAPVHEPHIIRRIPFESVRSFCAASGLHEGDHVERRSAWSRGPLVVETADGTRVHVPLEYAALIECEPEHASEHASDLASAH